MKKMFEIVHGDDDDDNVHRNMGLLHVSLYVCSLYFYFFLGC